jgi:hypothetical protein
MTDPKDREELERVRRELEAQRTDAARQRRGSTPPEHVIERALEIEPGVEQHAGEDAGEVPREDEDER